MDAYRKNFSIHPKKNKQNLRTEKVKIRNTNRHDAFNDFECQKHNDDNDDEIEKLQELKNKKKKKEVCPHHADNVEMHVIDKTSNLLWKKIRMTTMKNSRLNSR